MTGQGRPRLLLSELTKLLTLRSVLLTLLITVVLSVAMAALTAPAVGEGILSGDPDLAAGTVPEAVGLEWVILGQIGIIVVGVLAGSHEFTGRQVTTSLVAVPRRGRLVATKVLALTLVVLLTGVVAIPALSLLSQAGLGELGVLGDGVPESLVTRWLGALVFWLGMGLIGFALGMLMRQALVPLFVLIVVSQLSMMLVVLSPWSKVLPTVAGVQLFDPTSITAAFPDAALSPAVAYGSFTTWVLLLVVVAATRFVQRDVRS